MRTIGRAVHERLLALWYWLIASMILAVDTHLGLHGHIHVSGPTFCQDVWRDGTLGRLEVHTLHNAEIGEASVSITWRRYTVKLTREVDAMCDPPHRRAYVQAYIGPPYWDNSADVPS